MFSRSSFPRLVIIFINACLLLNFAGDAKVAG
jgi:hypothetical protein